MAEAGTLALGILLGLMFSGLMVFKILPALDHVVKKQWGAFEACLLTRTCCLLVGLPFYVFTIWMTVVILFDSAKPISVLEDICGDDFSCANTFAMGRIIHNKDACTSADCGDDRLFARSGSHPLSFPRLGLGENLSPVSETVEFSCEERNPVNNVCSLMEGGGDTCNCTAFDVADGHAFCSSFENCGDIDDQTRVETCLQETDGQCREWNTTTDSDKQFSFLTCKCDDDSCDKFTCQSLTMPYFYPNVFYAGLATILFIFPAMVSTYILAKTQLRKVLTCNSLPVYVYSQEGGMQEAFSGDDLTRGPGGFYEEQTQKTKYRTLSMKDVFGMLGGVAVTVFFSWLVVVVSGRVGLSFVALSASLIALVEIVNLVKTINKLKEQTRETVKRNNPNAARASL